MQLLGTFSLSLNDRPLALGDSAARLVVLLALQSGSVSRTRVTQRLWPDVPPARGGANLRSVLWRLRGLPFPLVHSTGTELRLDTQVDVDLRALVDIAGSLLDRSVPMPKSELSRALRLNFYEDLLPEWDSDEWLAQEREHFRQLRLHCLEVLCEELSAVGWHGAAVHTALAAVSADPFRESGYEVLIKAHLAAGNRKDALLRYYEFRRLLHAELGVQPSPSLEALVQDYITQRSVVNASPVPAEPLTEVGPCCRPVG